MRVLWIVALLVGCNNESDETGEVDPKSRDADEDGYVAFDDCDDEDPDVHPFHDEVCDGKDNDCDGNIDNDALDAVDWYPDSDGDGYGDPGFVGQRSCDDPGGHADNAHDCDDTDATVNPETVWYADADGDAYGDANNTTTACEQPKGYVADATDCDDTLYAARPGASEYCDGIDNDCDGSVDEDANDATLWYADVDGDGFGDADSTTRACDAPTGYVGDDSDCAPSDATAYPNSHETEVPGDGVDQDCDGLDACADLDCDSLPDLVASNRTDGSAYDIDSLAWYGGVSWSLGDATALPTDGARMSAAVDLDGDGYLEIVFANAHRVDDSAVDSYVYWGSASGYSSSSRTDLPTYNPARVCVDDLDADGHLDLLFPSHSDAGDLEVDSLIYWGSAKGFDSSDTTSLESWGALDCAIRDLDGDGATDVLLVSFGDNISTETDSYVYWGASSWSDVDRTPLPTLGGTRAAVDDLNADGNPDIVIANLERDADYSVSSYVYWGSAAGYSEANRDELPTNGSMDVTVADVDADGHKDLVFAGYIDNSGAMDTASSVYYGPDFSSADDLPGVGGMAVAVQDLDGDGYPELVFANSGEGFDPETDSLIYWGSKGGYDSKSATALPTTGARSVSISDLDEDGYADIVFGCTESLADGYAADSLIYWGSAKGWSAKDVTALDTEGAYDVRVVGR